MPHVLLKPLSVTCHFCLLLGLVHAPLPASAPMSSLITCSYTAILSHGSCPPCLLAVSSFTFSTMCFCCIQVFQYGLSACVKIYTFAWVSTPELCPGFQTLHFLTYTNSPVFHNFCVKK